MIKNLKSLSVVIVSSIFLIAIASASSFFIPPVNVVTASGSGPAPVTITYVSTATLGASTVYTYTAQPIGTAASDRIVLVAPFIRCLTTQTINSVTIAGNTATSIINVNNTTGGNSNNAAIFALAVPTGTTATIVVTATGACLRGSIGVWSMIGKSIVTATDTKSVSTGSSGNPSVSLNTGSNGAMIAMTSDGGGSSTGVTWTGVIENYDQIVGGVGGNNNSGASLNSNSGSPLSITATFSASSVDPALVSASWSN